MADLVFLIRIPDGPTQGEAYRRFREALEGMGLKWEDKPAVDVAVLPAVPEVL